MYVYVLSPVVGNEYFSSCKFALYYCSMRLPILPAQLIMLYPASYSESVSSCGRSVGKSMYLTHMTLVPVISAAAAGGTFLPRAEETKKRLRTFCDSLMQAGTPDKRNKSTLTAYVTQSSLLRYLHFSTSTLQISSS